EWALRHPADGQAESDVLLDVEPGKQRRAGVLEGHDATAAGGAARRAAATHRAGTGALEACEDVEQRRFAATGGAEQTENLAVCDLEIDAIEGDIGLGRRRENFPNLVELQHSCPPVERKT